MLNVFRPEAGLTRATSDEVISLKPRALLPLAGLFVAVALSLVVALTVEISHEFDIPILSIVPASPNAVTVELHRPIPKGTAALGDLILRDGSAISARVEDARKGISRGDTRRIVVEFDALPQDADIAGATAIRLRARFRLISVLLPFLVVVR